MQAYFSIFAIAALMALVITRAKQMKKHGIKAFHFGKLDKKDFFIPPFVFLYFYLIIANTFNLPRFSNIISSDEAIRWIGVIFCILSCALYCWGIISFGESFRVGIDMDKPGSLVSTGAFSVSRNPIYVAFFFILIGNFLIFTAWIFFAYLLAGLWLVDRQVCLEENALRDIYGKEYDDYCNKVRRYI